MLFTTVYDEKVIEYFKSKDIEVTGHNCIKVTE